MTWLRNLVFAPDADCKYLNQALSKISSADKKVSTSLNTLEKF